MGLKSNTPTASDLKIITSRVEVKAGEVLANVVKEELERCPRWTVGIHLHNLNVKWQEDSIVRGHGINCGNMSCTNCIPSMSSSTESSKQVLSPKSFTNSGIFLRRENVKRFLAPLGYDVTRIQREGEFMTVYLAEKPPKPFWKTLFSRCRM